MNVKAEFIDSSAKGWHEAVRIKIGKRSSFASQQRSLGIYQDNKKKFILDIHACDEYTCFESIKVVEQFVVVGFGESVCFFNVVDVSYKLVKMDGYFGELYTPDEYDLKNDAFQLLIASASHLHHFSSCGEQIWKSSVLGVDGVVVHDVCSGKIRVAGEWDPPDGWEECELNLENGVVVS